MAVQRRLYFQERHKSYEDDFDGPAGFDTSQ